MLLIYMDKYMNKGKPINYRHLNKIRKLNDLNSLYLRETERKVLNSEIKMKVH